MILSGCAGFPVPRQRYYQELGFVELGETFRQLPKAKTLRRWREEAPADFVFAFRAPQMITYLGDSPGYRGLPASVLERRGEYGHFQPTAAVDEAWEATRLACELLQAKALVFDSPPTFTPTGANQAALRSFFERIERPKGTNLVWRPQGVWDQGTVVSLCEELQLIPAADEHTEQVHPFSYMRLAHAYYTEDRLELLLDTLPEEGLVVFDCNESLRLASTFQRMLGEAL